LGDRSNSLPANGPNPYLKAEDAQPAKKPAVKTEPPADVGIKAEPLAHTGMHLGSQLADWDDDDEF